MGERENLKQGISEEPSDMTWRTQMSREEIITKIQEAEAAIRKTNSWKCRRDLEKYIKRLNKELRRISNEV